MRAQLPLLLVAALNLAGQSQPEAREIKPASVSGQVTTKEGLPIQKASLLLYWVGTVRDGDDRPRPYATTTDSGGKFLFEVVDPGQYSLSASRLGYLRQAYGTNRPNGAGATILSLSAGQAMSDLAITLTPQSVISGTVRDPDGDPVTFCAVRVFRRVFIDGKRQLVAVNNAQTDEEGKYKFRNLGPGKYYVDALPQQDFLLQNARSAVAPPAKGEPAKPEDVVVSTFYPGVIDIEAATGVEVASGTDRPGTDITMIRARTFHVRGKFIGPLPRNRSYLQASVLRHSAAMDDFGGGASGRIDKNGEFDLFPLLPGSYRITVSESSGDYIALASTNVEVGNQDVDNVTLVKDAPVTLTAILKIEEDPEAKTKLKPSPEVTQMHLRSTERAITYPGVAKDAGAFVFKEIFPGEYRLNFYALPDGTYVKKVRFGDQDLMATGLKVSAGAESTPFTIVLSSKAASLTGTVENAEGKSAQTAGVSLIPDPFTPDITSLYRFANTDQNGRFSMSSIAPGKYRLYAWKDLEPGSQYDPEFLKNYENAGTKLEIGESETAQVKLELIEN